MSRLYNFIFITHELFYTKPAQKTNKKYTAARKDTTRSSAEKSPEYHPPHTTLQEKSKQEL